MNAELVSPDSPSPLFVSDHLALDFLNTEIGSGPGRMECLASDGQVMEWLRLAGLLEEVVEPVPAFRKGTLLDAALTLRNAARELLTRRVAGQAGNPQILNRFLARGGSFQELTWKKKRNPECVRRRRVECPEDLLVPVAEAMAQLLVEGDFKLIRKCESPECTLWFYDRTKSHKRRWCSMAVCGNRMKVAAFRARNQTK